MENFNQFNNNNNNVNIQQIKNIQSNQNIQNTQNVQNNEKINIAPYFTAQGYGPEQLKYIIHPINKHSHWLLNDIHKTIDIIKKAQKIMVIGDYDLDGISATTIMVKGLRTIGKNVYYLIPNRFKDGYGLNINLVKKTINEYNCDTIITVDNGIAAYEPVKFAKEQGLTVVVTDHHKINQLPPADAIVHPAMGNYPFANISGCQVSYKIIMALFETYEILHKNEEMFELENYFLQLSSMSIVSDVMPVVSQNMEVNENRKWLIDGLKSINEKPALPIKLLMIKYNFLKVDETVLGFYIIPSINAIGRLEDATLAVDYFLSEHRGFLEKTSDQFVQINRKRRDLVEKQLGENKPIYSKTKKAVFVVGEDIHEGIAGLIAGKYSSGKGTISFCFTKVTKPDGSQFYKGSGRNDTSISLIEDVLNKIPRDTMLGYGGHHDACGLSVPVDKMEMFIQSVSEIADRNAKSNEQFVMKVKQDKLYQIVDFTKKFRPFGNGFTAPIVKVILDINNIMTTPSGFIKLGSNCMIHGENIDIWAKEIPLETYRYLDKLRNKKEHPSGSITYFLKTKASIVTEVSYGYKKNTELPMPSFNCIQYKIF